MRKLYECIVNKYIDELPISHALNFYNLDVSEFGKAFPKEEDWWLPSNVQFVKDNRISDYERLRYVRQLMRSIDINMV